MARKNFSDDFRRQAVELYESTPGATVKGIALDLGIERSTLRHWLDQLGSGTRTTTDGTRTQRPRPSTTQTRPEPGDPNHAQNTADGPETTEQRLARLETENATLRAERATLVTEREILRSAAKYFAGETNW